MKRFFLLFLIVLTVFAFIACKNEVAAEKEKDEVKPAEPITEPGVLFVRPAADCTWDDETDKGKFQFKLDVEFNANESIDLYAKFAKDVTEVAVRQAFGGNVKFKVNGAEYLQLEDLEQDEDGWYIVSIPAASVLPTDSGAPVEKWSGLGISVHLPDEKKAGCFIAIKGLKLGDQYFDITDWDEDSCAEPYYGKPSGLDVVLTLPTEQE